MQRKFYIAFSLDPASSTGILDHYREVRRNLHFFFNLPEDPDTLPHITVVPPFTATLSDIGNLFLLLSQDAKVRKDCLVWPAGYITFEYNGKSFGWNFNAAPKTETVIEKIYEVLKQYHIETIKTFEQTLETLHLTLMKEVTDEAVFEKGKRYLELHYPHGARINSSPIKGTLTIFMQEESQWKEWFVLKSEKSLSL